MNYRSVARQMDKIGPIFGVLAIACVVLLAFMWAFADIRDSKMDLPMGARVMVYGQEGVVVRGYSTDIGNSCEVYDVRVISAEPMYVQEFREDELVFLED